MKKLLRHQPFLLLIGMLLCVALPILGRLPPAVMIEVWGTLLFIVLSIGLVVYGKRAVVVAFNSSPSRAEWHIIGMSIALLGLDTQRVWNAVSRLSGSPDSMAATVSNYPWIWVFLVFVGVTIVSLASLRPATPDRPMKMPGFFIGFLTASALAISGVGAKLVEPAMALFGKFFAALIGKA